DTAVGAAAVLIGPDGGATLLAAARQSRSLPMLARRDDGSHQTYVDPRLQREVGVKSTLKRLGLAGTPAVVAVAGTASNQLGKDFDTKDAVSDPSPSAAAVIRLIADSVDSGMS